MKKFIVTFQVILILVLSIAFSQPLTASEKRPSNVLVIYSQHFNFQWVEELQKGINLSLESEDLYFYNEYLNEHQLSNTVSFEDLFNSMHAKYKNVKFDCIIVADNYAYNFMAEYYKKLAPNTPIVFVGVNGYSKDIAFTDMLTGIPQDSDMTRLIKLITSINDKDELIVISSENATSMAEISNIKNSITKDFPALHYRIVSEKTLDEVLDKLAGVKHAQLLMIGNIITAEGTMLKPEELVVQVFAKTHLPIYTSNRLQINGEKTGAVGGIVVNPYVHGKAAGLMAKQILDGVDVHKIPVRSKPLTTNVFNYNMLKYFNIKESSLPVDSVILGKPDNTISISRQAAASMAIIAFLIIIFLIVLLTKDKKLKQEIMKYAKSQKELQTSNDKFKTYIEKSPVGICILDNNGKYVEVNQMACQIAGYTEEEFLSMSIYDYVVVNEESAKRRANFNEIVEKGFATGEILVRQKNGEVQWINVTGAKINENCILCFFIDITERKERETKIEYISFHDSLTNVNNRGFFEQELKRLDTEEYLPLSYIITDTNGLRLINDTLGHGAGDIILIETAKVLQKNTRQGDVLARVGGDEFAILLPKTDSSEAQAIMESILAECQKTDVDIDGQKLQLNIALGCATKKVVAESLSYILKIAEGLMYRRKLLARDSYHSAFLSSLKQSLFERSHETEEHAERLVELTRMMGKALGLQLSQLNELQLLSTMHDIGKISIDNYILTKPGKLTEDEWLEMKEHSSIGYRIAMTSPDLQPIAPYILCHHERWDGTGYPQGLQGESIPLLSRILAVADAYDAMTSDRPYSEAISKEAAVAEIVRCSGSQFDPEIVKLFVEVIPTFSATESI